MTPIQKAKQIFNSIFNSIMVPKGYNPLYVGVMFNEWTSTAEAKALIVGLEVRKEDWVSVKHRLPPIGKQILIYEPDPNWKGQEIIAVSHYAGKKPRGEKYWYEWPDGQDEQPGSYYPTHWQPLPEPPKP